MSTRKASIKETGEELSEEQWERFDAAVAQEKAERLAKDPVAAKAARRSDDGQPADETAPSRSVADRR